MTEPTDPTLPGDAPAAETSAGSPADAAPDPPDPAPMAFDPEPSAMTASSDAAEHGAPIPFDAPAVAAGIAAPADRAAGEPLPPEPAALLESTAPADEAVPHRPSYIFFGAVAALSLAADVLSKAWAEVTLSKRTMLEPGIVLVKDHLSLTLAYNKGGAWGLLQTASEAIRKPFFLVVSVLAIAFIVSLYARLGPGQRALKWGLPLVLGGALGNLSDRIVRASVVDFVDYKAHWVEAMNRYIADVFHTWSITDHWPTFNVADICICVGVALMAIDMLTSRRHPKHAATQVIKPAEQPPASSSGSAGLAAESAGVASDPPPMS